MKVDRLKRESEMSVEELLAEYKAVSDLSSISSSRIASDAIAM